MQAKKALPGHLEYILNDSSNVGNWSFQCSQVGQKKKKSRMMTFLLSFDDRKWRGQAKNLLLYHKPAFRLVLWKTACIIQNWGRLVL